MQTIRPERPADVEAVGALVRAAFGEEGQAIAALVGDLRRAPTYRGGWVACGADPDGTVGDGTAGAAAVVAGTAGAAESGAGTAGAAGSGAGTAGAAGSGAGTAGAAGSGAGTAGDPPLTDATDATAAGRTVVGHVMLSTGWIDAVEALVPVPVLSPLAVATGRQGQGIGRALVAHAVAAADAWGAPGVILEGDPAYYARLGFTPAEDLGILRPSTAIPRAAFQWLGLSSYEPWMKGRFVYPDTFWRHDAVGLRDWRRERRTGAEWTTTTLGARDPWRLAAFYAELLGWGPAEGDDSWVVLRDPDGGRALAFQHEPTQPCPVWPAGPGDQHMQAHLEIRVEDLADGQARALALGAVAAATQPQDDVRVCLDPEGHPFCLWVPD